MAPEDYIEIVRESLSIAMRIPYAVAESEPDQFGSRKFTFLGGPGREVEVSIDPSGTVEAEWFRTYDQKLPPSNEHVTVEGARALGERIAKFFKNDDTAAMGPT